MGISEIARMKCLQMDTGGRCIRTKSSEMDKHIYQSYITESKVSIWRHITRNGSIYQSLGSFKKSELEKAI